MKTASKTDCDAKAMEKRIPGFFEKLARNNKKTNQIMAPAKILRKMALPVAVKMVVTSM